MSGTPPSIDPNLAERTGTSSPISPASPSTLGRLPVLLGVVAVVLAASALGVSLVSLSHVEGRGPAGPGALVNQTSHEETQYVTNATCTVANYSTVGFTVGGAGVIAVTATVALLLGHTNGADTSYVMTLQEASQACDALTGNWVTGAVDYSAPTTNYLQVLTMVADFTITTAGTYAYEVSGNFTMSYSGDFSAYNSVAVSGVFYPA